MKRKQDKMREEYPEELICSGVRGKHAQQFREGTNVVRIDLDLHAIFPNSDAVNRALRDYLTRKGNV